MVCVLDFAFCVLAWELSSPRWLPTSAQLVHRTVTLSQRTFLRVRKHRDLPSGSCGVSIGEEIRIESRTQTFNFQSSELLGHPCVSWGLTM